MKDEGKYCMFYRDEGNIMIDGENVKIRLLFGRCIIKGEDVEDVLRLCCEIG